MTTLKSEQLELISSFFQERIEQVTAKHGSVIFIQRPKVKAEGFAASADDLADMFTVLSISANSSELYRICIGPLTIVINYDPVQLHAELIVSLTLPILGTVKVAHAQGNIKTGVFLKVGYKGIASGEVGLRLDGNIVVLYWDVDAFSVKHKDEIELLVL